MQWPRIPRVHWQHFLGFQSQWILEVPNGRTLIPIGSELSRLHCLKEHDIVGCVSQAPIDGSRHIGGPNARDLLVRIASDPTNHREQNTPPSRSVYQFDVIAPLRQVSQAVWVLSVLKRNQIDFVVD
jgi:hypothetical protein